jgi:hypothetical protein
MKKEIDSFNEVPSHSELLELDEKELEQVQAGGVKEPPQVPCPELRSCGVYLASEEPPARRSR